MTAGDSSLTSLRTRCPACRGDAGRRRRSDDQVNLCENRCEGDATGNLIARPCALPQCGSEPHPAPPRLVSRGPLGGGRPRWDETELLKHRQLIHHSPVLDHLAAVAPAEIECRDIERSPRQRLAHEGTGIGALKAQPPPHLVFIGGQVLDRGSEGRGTPRAAWSAVS